MRFVIWLMITALFAVSMAGVLLSVILWSEKARGIILSAWVALGDRQQLPNLNFKALALYEEVMGRLLLRGDGKVSKLKISFFSIFASFFWLFGAVGANPGSSLIWLNDGRLMAVFFLFVVPMHWSFEYIFSKYFYRSYIKFKNKGLMKATQRAFISGLAHAGVLALTIVLFFLVAASLRHYFYGVKILQDIFDFSFATLRFNGGSALIMILYAELIEVNGYQAPFFVKLSFLISVSISCIALITLLGSASIINSRRLLVFTAKVCETLAAQSAKSLLAMSMILLGLEPVQNLLRTSDKKANWTNCKLVLSSRSQFFQSRRHFSSQANDRSTIQRFGITSKV